MRVQARNETLQERVASLQQEVLMLKQQNDDIRRQGLSKDKAESHEQLNNMLKSLRDDHEKVSFI